MNDKDYDEGVFNEKDLKDLMKEAIREVNKEKVEEKKKQIVISEEKYNGLNGKKKLIKILYDEREKALLYLSSLNIDDEDYRDALDKYNRLNDAYEDICNNPLQKIDWTKVITTLIIVGAAGALIFIMLLIENSAAFPRCKNAMNMILSIWKKAL